MVYFREEQRFDWFWMPLTAVPAAIVGYGIYRQEWSGRPVFDQPGAAILLWSAFAVTFGVFVWFLGIKLISEVRPQGLWIRFYWLRPERLIPWSEIERAEAVTYRPIRDFGGWGVRWAPRGIVYNTRGHRGVRIFLTNGQRVVLGSQRAGELASAIAERLSSRPLRP
jgi:hypothetical protein